MVTLQNMKSKYEIFIFNLENKLIPGLDEKFNCTNDNHYKIEYSLDEIKKILETNSTTDYIYTKLKNLLLDTKIGVSIKKIPNNTKLMFFRKTDVIKRESDIFKLKIEKIINSNGFIKYLNENTVFKVSVTNFKNVFDFSDYDTMTLYKKIKYSLINSEIDISLARNVLYEKEVIDVFKFYYKKDYNEIIADRFNEDIDEINDVEIDEDKKEYIDYINESEKRDKEEELKTKKRIVNEGAELIRNYIIPDVEACKCPRCKKGILKYPEIECPVCKIKVLEKWD